MPGSHVKTVERSEAETNEEQEHYQGESCNWLREDITEFYDENLSEEAESPNCEKH